MTHWASKYTGQKWTEDHDCYYWFCRILAEQFGTVISHRDIDHHHLVACATRILTGDIEENFGYRKTDTPKEGDAVFLTQRKHPHHIGVVIKSGGLQIIHALQGSGVIVSDLMDLRVNGWRIAGYWTDAR